MNILIIGSGGREHALVRAFYKSPNKTNIFVAPGNPGMLDMANQINIDIGNFEKVKEFCNNELIDLLVVGPEQPLADGIVDAFDNEKTLVFGPKKIAAQLESSKDYAKQIMGKYNIPTAKYKAFSKSEIENAHEYIKSHTLPVVLKADGLAGGKGVIIAETSEEAIKGLNEMFAGAFGSAGQKIVIEEFMQGEEASIFAVCDGKNYITLAPSQDHKRALDGDKGKNTGGMGAYAPAPIVTGSVLERINIDIIEPILKAMQDENSPYIGCLYVGVMIENDMPRVVEFNVRFGDPETQAVLPLFKGDFAQLLYSAAAGNLDKTKFEQISNNHSACVILASNGYPDAHKKGYEITGLDNVSESTFIYHSGTRSENAKILSNGGRVLAINAISDTLEKAVKEAYILVDKVNFENKYYRKDIGHRAIKTR